MMFSISRSVSFIALCVLSVNVARPALAAQPTAEQLALLRTFREEFVKLTPGMGGFPGEVTIGRDDGPPSERPATKVVLDHSFAVAKYEVPQNLWEAVMGANPSKWKGPRNSVEMLSFDDAVGFCREATRLMRAAKLIDETEEIRLPTEAEWEYFTRAGTTTLYSFGDDLKDLDDYAWHTGNAAGNDPPVGAKKPNAWGLYDVHGYLWEWCADDWTDDWTDVRAVLSEPGFDASQPRRGADTGKKVLRGGSWKDKADALTSSYRRPAAASLKDDAVGLRCVLVKKK